MKSYAVHYLNKYPGGRVDSTEERLMAFNAAGALMVAICLTGHGQIKDIGAESGARDSHDMSPIPKNARIHKLFADGSVGKDEKAEQRKAQLSSIVQGDKVLSIEEYRAKGFVFDQNEKDTLARPPAKAPEPSSDLE